MFDETDVAMWCKLLGQAARERNPEKLAGILALIETAAKAERNDLQRQNAHTAKRNRRHATQVRAETHPWSTLLACEEDSIPLGSDPSRNSELYLRYLRLADSALGGAKAADDHSRKKRKAA